MFKATPLFVFISLILLVSCQSNGPCNIKAGEIISWEDAADCIYSIKMNEEVKVQTLDVLTKMYQLYAFLDIANDSPDQTHLPMRVHLLDELEIIGNRPYEFDFEFHNDLRYLYDQLNDAHTQYYLPNCYRAISARQPISPVCYTNDNGEQVIAVSEYFDQDLVDYFKQKQNFDVTQLKDATIETVNGIPAFDYFLGYANHSVGMAKDIGTRLNVVMVQPEPRPDISIVAASYWQTRTKRNPFPKQPTVYYTFKFSDGTTKDMSFDWTAISTTTYNGTESFMEDYWNPNPTGEASRLAGESDNLDFENLESKEVTKRKMNIPSSSSLIKNYKHIDEIDLENDELPEFTMLVNSTSLTFWMLNDSTTAVMYLDTMAPRLIETFKALNEGFEACAKHNLKRLIIDLTNNGGGSICFGRSLLAYFQGEDGIPNWGPQDLPLSELQKNLTLQSVNMNKADTVWSPGFYDNQDNEPISNSDTSYLIPGIPHVRGGLLRNYSKRVHINNCGNFGYRIEPAVRYSPSDIRILTHGFCGSTCALFTNHLAIYDNVQTIVVGGIDNRPMQYTAFPGLQVLDAPDFYSQFVELGLNVTADYVPDDIIPRELLTSASFRACIREIYPLTKTPGQPIPTYSQTKPMEFTFQQADVHLSNTLQTANHPEYNWYRIFN